MKTRNLAVAIGFIACCFSTMSMAILCKATIKFNWGSGNDYPLNITPGIWDRANSAFSYYPDLTPVTLSASNQPLTITKNIQIPYNGNCSNYSLYVGYSPQKDTVTCNSTSGIKNKNYCKGALSQSFAAVSSAADLVLTYQDCSIVSNTAGSLGSSGSLCNL